MDNFKYPEIVAQMRSYWLMGQTGGFLLNGHFGYREIAPESTAELLAIEFESYEGPIMEVHWSPELKN